MNVIVRPKAIRHLMEIDLKPRDIMTAPPSENAMVTLMALGGSTNAVLHLIAMARSVDVSLTIDDFQRVSDRVPSSPISKPSGNSFKKISIRSAETRPCSNICCVKD